MSPVASRAALGAGRWIAAVAALTLLSAAPSRACVGVACMLTWSTEENGGALTLEFDFATKKAQTFRVTVVCPGGQCFYSAVDPGFMNTGEPPPAGFHTLADGTTIRFKLIDKDPAAIVKINGVALQPNESALLGTTPELHSHPSWQLSLPEGVQGDYPVSFTLTTNSSLYTESRVFQLLLTNLPTPTPDAPTPSPSPTPTATAAIPACIGDCDGNGDVAINELVLAVASALADDLRCAACDEDRSGRIEINELVSAVNSALDGCAATPTPTATLAPHLAVIQQTIFSPRCAIPSCHNSETKAGNLILDAEHAYAQLVGVEPLIENTGMQRVTSGEPKSSFLLVKLEGPGLGQGSRMPQTGPLLTDAEIQLIRDWIALGANPLGRSVSRRPPSISSGRRRSPSDRSPTGCGRRPTEPADVANQAVGTGRGGRPRRGGRGALRGILFGSCPRATSRPSFKSAMTTAVFEQPSSSATRSIPSLTLSGTFTFISLLGTFFRSRSASRRSARM